MKLFNRYSPKPLSKGTDFSGRAEVCNQLMAEECEIKKLLYDYEKGVTSTLPVVRDAQYNDVMITPTSYEEAKAMVDKVNSDFFSLPADVQRQFGNIETYVSDLSKIANGDSATIAKYNKFSISSPLDGAQSIGASGTSSLSLSRSDSENSSSSLKPSNEVGFAESKE